jgi:hypothetical protein
VILYTIYKKQQNHYTIGVALLQERPWKDFYSCDVAPGARAAHCSPELGELAGARGRGRGGGGSLGYEGAIWVLGRGGGGSGGGVRRRPGAPTAAAGNAGEGEASGGG